MFGYKSVWPGQQALAEPRYKLFSLSLRRQIFNFNSHPSTEVKFSRVSGSNSDTIIDATILESADNYLASTISSNGIDHQVGDEQSELARCSRKKEHDIVGSDSLACKVSKKSISFSNNDQEVKNMHLAKIDCCPTEKFQRKENIVVAADSLSRKYTKCNSTSSTLWQSTNVQTQSNSSNRQAHVSPLLDECDWQLGQFLRCIYLNKDITLCEMFNDSWKDCKKKAGSAMLQKTYMNCTQENCVRSKE